MEPYPNPESQLPQQHLSKSIEPKVKQLNYLKKGDKSRVYDPKEAIRIQKK